MQTQTLTFDVPVTIWNIAEQMSNIPMTPATDKRRIALVAEAIKADRYELTIEDISELGLTCRLHIDILAAENVLAYSGCDDLIVDEVMPE